MLGDIYAWGKTEVFFFYQIIHLLGEHHGVYGADPGNLLWDGRTTRGTTETHSYSHLHLGSPVLGWKKKPENLQEVNADKRENMHNSI